MSRQQRRRQQRRRQRHAQGKRPITLWVGISALLALIVAVVVYTAIQGGSGAVAPEEDDSTSLLGQFYPTLGNRHLAPGESFNEYNSNPPTSGPHAPRPAPWGILDTPVPREMLVHNMEHAGVVIWYNAPSSPELIADLEALVQSYLSRGRLLVMAPYPDMDATIALTGWTRLLELDSFDEAAIRSFIETHERRYNPEGF